MGKISAVVVLVLVVVGCSDDGNTAAPTTTASASATTTVPVGGEAPRLKCQYGVQFSSVSPPPGQQFPATPEEAAKAEVDDPSDSISLIGEEKDGLRYAVLNAAGVVTKEIVVRDDGDGFRLIFTDTCKRAPAN